jgi:threonine/homoserine/homoserine lactone efflux protein
VLCMLWYGGLAVGFSNETVQRGYRRWAQAINYLLAGLLLWFALRLLLTMVR